MRYKPLVNYDKEKEKKVPEPKKPPELPEDEQGNPLILPPEVWRNTVVKFDKLLFQEKRQFPRVRCFAPVVFHDDKGRIVATGTLRDINEKSGGFEIKESTVKPDDTLYLQFLETVPLTLTQVKVSVKRVQSVGFNTRIGVEFADMTHAFEEKLTHFLAKMRATPGFADNEII